MSRGLWRLRPLAEAVRTGGQLDALAQGCPAHLSHATVHTAGGAAARFGMCGHLTTWQVTA